MLIETTSRHYPNDGDMKYWMNKYSKINRSCDDTEMVLVDHKTLLFTNMINDDTTDEVGIYIDYSDTLPYDLIDLFIPTGKKESSFEAAFVNNNVNRDYNELMYNGHEIIDTFDLMYIDEIKVLEPVSDKYLEYIREGLIAILKNEHYFVCTITTGYNTEEGYKQLISDPIMELLTEMGFKPYPNTDLLYIHKATACRLQHTEIDEYEDELI